MRASQRDKQYLVSFAQLPQGATLDRTEKVISAIRPARAKKWGNRPALLWRRRPPLLG
jgi:multidrug efflux pump subunit AcrB